MGSGYTYATKENKRKKNKTKHITNIKKKTFLMFLMIEEQNV